LVGVVPYAGDGYYRKDDGEEKVPAGVGVLERVVEAVCVPVKVLRIGRIRDYAVGTDEPPDRGVVVPGIIKVKAAIVKPLAAWWAKPALLYLTR